LSKFQPRARSAARDKLQECIEARAEVGSRLAELQASVTKLNSQIAAVAPAEAALADLNTKEDYAALRWATSGESERPTPDIEARDRLARELAAARASAESATRASAVLSAEIARESSKPNDIAKYADAAVIEVIAETASPMVDDLESDAIELVTRIVGLRTAAELARGIAERRQPRALSVAEHELRSMGRGLAIQHTGPEDETPPEARAAVGALTERLRPAVWSRIAEAIVEAVKERRGDITGRIIPTIAAWRTFESELRSDAGIRLGEVA
jgi:hypothetical protein